MTPAAATLTETLGMTGLLADAGPDAVRRFAAIGRLTNCARDHVLWRMGDPAREMLVVVTGEAETIHRTPGGRAFIDRFLGPGECMGIVSAADGNPHPHEARVVRGGAFYVVQRAGFLRFLEDHAAARTAVLRMIARLYRRGLREREDIMGLEVRKRLAAFLLRHSCVRHADGARILLHANHADIAARIGTVREVVARSFTALRVAGLVDRDGAALYVTDWAGLCAEAEAPYGGDAADAAVDASPLKRTQRFFLPSRADSPGRVCDDALPCLRRHPDLSVCRARGCTAALSPLFPR